MMRKKVFSCIITFAVIILSLFVIWSRDIYSSPNRGETKAKTGNQLIIAHTEIFGKLERPPVLFRHGLHSDKFKREGCNTCHPAASEGTLIFDFPFTRTAKGSQSVKDSYHKRCLNCHNKMIEERKKTGPIRCGDCHRKELVASHISYPACDFDFSYHNKHVKKLKERTGRDSCGLCHHTFDPEETDEALRLIYEEGTEESCSYCHDLEKERGPVYAVITQAAFRKGLSIKKVSHQQCINCHLQYNKKGMSAGPTECVQCHTGKHKTIAELADMPRPDRGQPKKTLITIEEGQMKGVPFDHTFHEKNLKTCRVCHHETLNACKNCHGLKGNPEGRWINTAGAYHDVSSEFSCAGCHNRKKKEKNCEGCHHHLLGMDIQAKGPKKEICTVCHSGRKERSEAGKPFALTELTSRGMPEKVTIKVLENEYEPAAFPHLKIVKKLAAISNDSRMTVSFHRDIRVICRGCHHQSNAQAEAKKGKPPYCRSCHSVSFDSKNMNRPRLLAVYHRQCMGCHEKMDIRAVGCVDCHKRKNAPSVPPLLKGDTEGWHQGV